MPLEVLVVQSSSSKHNLPTDLKKCETVVRFISRAIIDKPKSEVWYKKQRMGDRLLHEKYGLGSGIGCTKKKVNQPFGKKNGCEETEGLESAKKCYHRCNRPHKRAVTGRLRGRGRSRTATDLIHHQRSCLSTGSEFPSSSFQFAHSAQPDSDSSVPNSSPPLSWLSGDDKLRSWRWCFSTKQQLNTGRSLPVPYLNLWFRFTAAATAEAVIYKLLSLNCFMLLALNALFHKKTVNHFFH